MKHLITLPEDWMPFITMKKTVVQAKNSNMTIHHLRPPLLSISGAASSVVRYQKYAVSDDFSHSAAIVPFISGQYDQGNGF
jgi:hypothetical protein